MEPSRDAAGLGDRWSVTARGGARLGRSILDYLEKTIIEDEMQIIR